MNRQYTWFFSDQPFLAVLNSQDVAAVYISSEGVLMEEYAPERT